MSTTSTPSRLPKSRRVRRTPDPRRILSGKGKFERFLSVRDETSARSAAIRHPVRAEAGLRPWD